MEKNEVEVDTNSIEMYHMTTINNENAITSRTSFIRIEHDE